jgi:predicted NBD/HSP70 family sugar kinase
MSRADVARQSGLSEGTVSRIMTDLIAEELVREDGEENSTGGRPGRRLQLDPRRVAVGADIQNWETRVAVGTMRGRIVESRAFRTPASMSDTLDRIADEFLEYRRKFGVQRAQGLGVCARGIVNSETGVIVLGSRPDWVDVPVRSLLESRVGEAVYLENNVRAAAVAEYNYGSREVSPGCFVFVKVDEGLGMGILIDGRLYTGPRMAAGEFGQMVIAMAPGNERHDRFGCLERLVADPAVCDRYAAYAREHRSELGETTMRARRIVRMAADGDEAARRTLRETARYLGVGISNVVWGLDAEVVVIDGAVTSAWSLIERVLRNQLPDEPGMHVLLRPSALGGEASLIGAATLPFTTVFSTGESRRATGASA